jgi:multiple sugar transport system substrate-binding protein
MMFCMALAAGCTAAPSASLVPPAPGGTTVVWLSDPTAETATDDVRQVLKDAFEEAHPSINLQLMTGPTTTDKLKSVLSTQLKAGAATPDVYEADVVWQYEFAANGYALPLNNLAPGSWNSSGIGSEKSVAATFDDAMKYKGSYYGVPYFIDEGFLYYRRDLLEKAKLLPPRTWEQLEKDSLILNKKGLPSQFVWQGANYEGLTCDWYEFMTDAFGNKPPPGTTPAQELDSPKSMKALNFMRGLIEMGVSPNKVDTFTETDTNNEFAEGQAAFMRGWDSAYVNTTNADSTLRADQVGVELPPVFDGQPGPSGWSALGGWSLDVNPHSKNLDAALTFIQWMAGQQAQRILATQYSLIPGNAAVRNDPAIASGNPVLSLARQARVVARPAQEPKYPQVSSTISSAIYRALPGAGSPGRDPCAELTAAARRLGLRTGGGLTCPP